MRLYDLTEQYQDILDLMEVDPNSEQLQTMLNGLEGVIGEKVENIIKVAKTLEGEAKVIEGEIKRLQERKTAKENNRKRLLEHAEGLLSEVGLERLKGTLFNVWMQDNPPSVKVLNESVIPRRFYKNPDPILSKKEIMDAIRAGEEVPGVEIVQGRGLRVR